MPKTYLENILWARRLSTGSLPAETPHSDSSPGLPKSPTFEYTLAEIRNPGGDWENRILSRYYDYDAARGVVMVCAAALISPLAATYVLGLRNGGFDWMKSQYPNLAFGLYGMSVSTRNGESFADSLGLTSIDIESKGAFDLLTLSHPKGDIQFLACFDHPKAFCPVAENGRLSFQKHGLDPVVQAMVTWTNRVRDTNDFGCFQDPDRWKAFLAVVQNARSACDITGELTLSFVGADEIAVRCESADQYRPDKYAAFEQSISLAYARYAPNRLLERPQRFHQAMAPWYRQKAYSPALVLPSRDFSPRERLLSCFQLESWLELGGASLETISSWEKRDVRGLTREFVSRHRKKRKTEKVG